MAHERPASDLEVHLPEDFRKFFGDTDFDALSWSDHRDFTVSRILISGDRESMRWLRRTLGDAGLRDWLIRRRGDSLDKRRLRYWELILELDPDLVGSWIARQETNPWFRRLG